MKKFTIAMDASPSANPNRCFLFMNVDGAISMKIGNSLQEAKESEWQPYKNIIEFYMDPKEGNKERSVYAYFLLADGTIIILSTKEPPLFSRWVL